MNKITKLSKWLILNFSISLSINIMSWCFRNVRPIGALRKILGISNWFIFIPLLFISYYLSFIILRNYKQINLSKKMKILLWIALSYYSLTLLISVFFISVFCFKTLFSR